MEATRNRIWQLAEPVADSYDLDVLELELAGASRGKVVRIYLDTRDPETGVSIDDCQAVSRELSDVLEVHDAISGHFMLEVSSPGVNRPLRKPEHFQAVLGQRVRLRTREPIDGQRGFLGKLVEADDVSVTVEDQSGETVRIALVELEKGNLEYDFGDPPAHERKRKPGGSRRKKNK